MIWRSDIASYTYGNKCEGEVSVGNKWSVEYIQNLASSFSKAFFHSLPRQCNNVAHMMAAYAMENKDSSIWLGSYYEYIHLHCF